MTLIQKILARFFRFEYVLIVGTDHAEVGRVKRLGKYLVLTSGRRLKPGGGISGVISRRWEPLTPGSDKYYKLEII